LVSIRLIFTRYIARCTGFIVFVQSTLFLSACSPLEILNSTVDQNGFSSRTGLVYGGDDRQKLDVHIPNHAPQNADVVVFYYGGRWQYGSKQEYAFVVDALTSKGFVTVIPDYRLYPQVDWQAFVQDGANAYQWVYKNIQKFGGNPRRIFVMGHSAGAHISAMVAVDDSLLDKATKRPCGFVGLAGPYDFLPIDQPDIRRVFASESDLQKTQPISYASRDDPAMLLIHGLDDDIVKPGNSRRLAQRLSRLGGDAEIKLYEDTDHIDILLSLSSTFRYFGPTLTDSVVFMNSVECG